jgi:AAA family ATP:ADP antiporter
VDEEVAVVSSVEPARLSTLERLLRLFTDVQPGEGITAVVMFANVFLILCAYYFVKPLRDGWIAITDVGSLSKLELKAYTSFAQSLLLVGAVGLFGRLASLWPRRTLIFRSTLFCMTNLIVFWFLRPGGLSRDLPAAGVAFYVWVGMFGVFVVAQFWAFAADLYTDERGRRLMPLIGIGATLGAVAGSFFTERILRAQVLDSGTLLLAANVPLGVSLVLTTIADRRGATGVVAHRGARRPAAAPAEVDVGEGLALVWHDRYLIAVAVMTLVMSWVGTNGENLLFSVVQDAIGKNLATSGISDPRAASKFVREGTTAFYGGFFFWVNTCALGLQALITSRLLRYGGFAPTLLLLPLVALFTYSGIALLPVLLVIRVLKTAENSIGYSINNTARQVLWLPTTAEMKYKAKPAIETFFVRLGDGLAAATVVFVVELRLLTTSSALLLNIGLTVLWLLIAGVVIREHQRLAGRASG